MAPERQRPSSKAKQARSKSPRGMQSGKPVPAQRVNQAIPEAVANRMMRRIAFATGLPTLLGMGVFIVSYVLVSRHWLAIPPSATLLASGACFLLGLVGLSYGVLSASWETEPGSLWGQEQIPVNLSRMRDSLRALRQGPQSQGKGPS